ncbi:molybdopterin molybdotransferase [Chitinivorax tropicus]|uniref:Molybdopterin molybdenumtransferase n=1 Tax=Chitinivorax tropicus TaxID=714531 RepID=A0A840MUK2_9PROT|nr:gephyrin-like molybdotransferase Glp [Chitinivorax tropicus]MBB5020003.1 molybdopterin molybdotransferase [Chitinivorax tropicus]
MTHPTPLTVDEALAQVLAQATITTQIVDVPLTQAHQHILAIDQISPLDVPPHDNSAMDGYAVNVTDLAADPQSALPVSQRIPAGTVGQPLQSGTVARIFTGAPIPPGCDAVVMQEDTISDGEMIRVTQPVKLGQHIRRKGEDIAQGSVILPAGSRLGAAQLGLAASVGLATLPIRRALKVAILSTGDELVDPGSPLGPGQIYNSNRYVLTSLLANLGCEVLDQGNIPDNLRATQDALQRAATEADLILSCGGVSVGEEDHVKAAIEATGSLNLWRIAMKPGKPLAMGKVGTTPFIGLPGNPVSAFVTFLLFVRPFILTCQGASQVLPAPLKVTAGFDWPKPDKRREFLRARLTASMTGAPEATLFAHQGSGVLTSCAWADGLVDVPAGRAIKAGELVSFVPFSHLQAT